MTREKKNAKSFGAEDVAASADKLVQLFAISEKQAKKIARTFDYGRIEELGDMGIGELEALAAACYIEAKGHRDEVEANEEYQRAKEDLKVFNSGLKEVCDPLRAAMDVATLFVTKKKRAASEI